MEIRETEFIFKAGKETVVRTLLEMDARIASLAQEVITPRKQIDSL